ncbi:MAG TPA: GNAT family N-acetyltransferase, partial [Pseudonocardia sp.]|nr:GNAT family N-acetyltransferase [Pseudonocardia sp.]
TSPEIVGECRFVRLANRQDTADVAVTVVDAWQDRGLATALLGRLSRRALEEGVEYFSAEVLAENRTVLAMLPRLGRVESERHGTMVTARIEIAQPPEDAREELLDLLRAAARGDLVGVPGPIRDLIRASAEAVQIVLMPVNALLGATRPEPVAEPDGGSGPRSGREPGPAGEQGPGP